MSSLSTHVLDTERGIPAVGVRVTLFRGDQQVASGRTGPTGRIEDLGDGSLAPDVYRLEFHVADYLHAQGRNAPFLQRVTLTFRLEPGQAHYHVPLLLTPFACTTYRGA